MNEITEKWDKTGLLDQMKPEHKDKMAEILDNIAIELIRTAPPDNTPERTKHEEFCGTVLPIARRLFDQLGPDKFPGDKWLMKDFGEYYKQKADIIKDLNSYISLDGEAEFCSLYCEDVAKRVKEMKIDIGIPEVELKVSKEPIVAGMRKMKNV